MITMSDVNNQNLQQNLTSPLQFVELFNCNREYLALVDTGAQINLVNEVIAERIEVNSIISSSIESLKGVDDSRVKIRKWITADFVLKNGYKISLPLAVTEGVKALIILGLPFLKQIRGRIDPYNRLIEMTSGPIQLLETSAIVLSVEINEVKVTEAETPDVIPSIVESTNLSEQGKIRLRSILDSAKSVYEQNRIGSIVGIKLVIRLRHERPIACKPRVHSKEHEQAINQEVQKMLEDKIIVPSDSPYSTEIVVVKKKSGEWRICIDYRRLNDITIDDKYHLPRINDLLFDIKASGYYVALDLRSGYWQIPMSEESRRYTAFRGPTGLYEFSVMPFGLKNAPATFQRCMDALLGDLRYKNVLAYLDDILIHHEEENACLDLLKVVLKRLELAGLTINLSKCTFFPYKLKYLGHYFSKGQMQPDLEKIKCLDLVKSPKTVAELRSILGLVGYFQNYVPNYSTIVLPLNNLLKGTVNLKAKNRRTSIQWSPLCDESLKKLLGELKKATLYLPCDKDQFVVETDASDHCIGGALMVRRDKGLQPVFFVSKKLNSTEQRWATREKEAFAIIHCLSKFDRFIRGSKFEVITDNQSLQWLFDAKVGKLARWAILMSEYDMTIKWRKGGDNVVTDYLSRYVDCPDPVEDRMVYNVLLDDDMPSIPDILEAQKSEGLPTGRGYVCKDGKIYYRGGYWVSEKYRNRIIATCHLLPPLSHPGIKRTKRIILRVFNWPDLHTDVTNYVKACIICQRRRSNLKPLTQIPQAPVEGIFSVLHIDFWHCQYKGEQFEVLTMIDSFSRWVEAELVQDRSAKTVSTILLKSWICRFGIPRRIVSDNELSFVSDLIKELCGVMGITKISTIPYRPQGNSPIESFHKTLNRLISNFSGKIPFQEALHLALYSYRVTLHTSTGESPAFLIYGKDLMPPQDCDWRFITEISTRERIRFVNDLRRDIFLRAYEGRKFQLAKLQPTTLEKDDLVLARLNQRERYLQAIRDETGQKLLPKNSLPGRVENISENGQRVIIRFLLSGRLKLCHISDIIKVNLPMDHNQRLLWDREQSETREIGLEQVERPQEVEIVEELERQRQKRPRVL